MNQVIDALVIALGLDPKGVDDGMKQAENRINTGVQTVMRILAPLAGAFSFAKLWQTYSGDARALGELSRLTGESAGEIDAWSQAATRAGASASGMQGAIASLSTKLRDNPAELRRWGIEAQTAGGALAELSSLSERVSERRFFQIGKSLGLDERTISFLRQGRTEVDGLVGSMRKVALTGQDAESLRRFDQDLHELSLSFRSLAAGIMRVALPAFKAIVGAVNSFFKLISANREIPIAAVTLFAAALTGKLVPALGKTTLSFGKLGLAMLTNPLTWIIGGLGLLVFALQDLYTYSQGGESSLEDLWKTFGTGAEVAEKIGAVIDTVGEKFEALAEAAGMVRDVIKSIEGAIPEGLMDILKTVFSQGNISNTAIKVARREWEKQESGQESDSLALGSFALDLASPARLGMRLSGNGGLLDGVTRADQAARTIGAGLPEALPAPEQAAALAVGGNTSNQYNSDTRVSIDNMTVTTQATNADEMARNAGPALQNSLQRNRVNNMSLGVRS